MPVITLIGYRGSGKSSVAEPLAERLGFSWIDADDEIERVAGKSIATIFAEEGEPRFRQVEREVMQDLLGRDKLIIAAGGGAILNAETRREMREAGPVI
ncbi:MAG: AAA family ATPase, partial [Planctomycetaceae bacterium]|nr:AAA family ATPase [Planctomycetaceae bacterium]